MHGAVKASTKACTLELFSYAVPLQLARLLAPSSELAMFVFKGFERLHQSSSTQAGGSIRESLPRIRDLVKARRRVPQAEARFRFRTSTSAMKLNFEDRASL